MLTRRELLAIAAAGVLVPRPRGVHAASSIHTVTGPVAPDRLGVTLPHEHVLVDFIGASEVSAARYERKAAFDKALPHLRRLVALGCRTLVECTPAYLGRDPVLLRDLSKATGLQILTNTGYYGAVSDKFLPPHAFSESADALARLTNPPLRKRLGRFGAQPGLGEL